MEELYTLLERSSRRPVVGAVFSGDGFVPLEAVALGEHVNDMDGIIHRVKLAIDDVALGLRIGPEEEEADAVGEFDFLKAAAMLDKVERRQARQDLLG